MIKDQLLIIGDIAGRYNELMALLELAKERHGEFTTISVGDLVDRGPDSKKVLEHFMTAPDTFCVKGNHEDLMYDHCSDECRYEQKYRWNVWVGNGGKETITSYRDEKGDSVIPVEHITFLKELPVYIRTEGVIVTHAPINPSVPLDKWLGWDTMSEYGPCWNRGRTKRIEGVLQVHGHNAGRKVTMKSDDRGVHTVNVDTSKGEILSGLLWPSMEIVQVKYETT